MNIYRSNDAQQRKTPLRPLTPKKENRPPLHQLPTDNESPADSQPAVNSLRRVERTSAGDTRSKAPARSVGIPPSGSGPSKPYAVAQSLIERSIRVPLWAAIAIVLVVVAVPTAIVLTQAGPFSSSESSAPEVEQAADPEPDVDEADEIEAYFDEELFEQFEQDIFERPEMAPRAQYLAEQGVSPEDQNVLYRAEEVERLQQELEAIQRNSALLRSLARQQSGDLSAAYSSLEATEDEKEGALEDLQQRIDELEGRVQTVDELARELRRLLGLPESQSGVGGPAQPASEDVDPWLALRTDIVSIEQRAGALVYDLNEVNTEIQLRLARMQQTGLPHGGSIEADLQFYESMPVGFPIDGPITSRFGLRGNPFGVGTDNHTGIDISAPLGSPVRATGSGTVRVAGEYGGYGLLVIVDHGRGVSTWYGHNSVIRVSPGQTVSAGHVLADVGSTGMSTGPHVHYEIRINNNPQDPLSMMQMER